MSSIVLGTGAVGVFFAHELMGSGEDVRGVDTSPTVMPITLALEEGERTFSFEVGLSLGEMVDRCEGGVQRVFVCVPPQAIPAVARSIHAGLTPGTPVVFCNNGMVLPEVCEVLEDFPIWRALIFAGFSRLFSKVSYNGGRKVLFGPLNESARRIDRERICEGFRILQWHYEADIRKIEAEKLFVNFVLARVIGHESLPNSEFWVRQDSVETAKIARTYASVVGVVSAEELLAMLEETVLTTAANVNSISLSLIRGDAEPWRALCTQIEALAQSALGVPGGFWLAELARDARKGML